MAPSRAKQQSSVAGTSKERPHRKSKSHPYSNKQRRQPTREDALPGLQKLKSTLRQTKRLLAKDNLAANVRVETERRLKSLEADLARAELSRKERQHATRYHRVKFFGEWSGDRLASAERSYPCHLMYRTPKGCSENKPNEAQHRGLGREGEEEARIDAGRSEGGPKLCSGKLDLSLKNRSCFGSLTTLVALSQNQEICLVVPSRSPTVGFYS